MATRFPVPDLRSEGTRRSDVELSSVMEDAPSTSNAEQVVDKSYRMLTDYQKYAEQNLEEARAKVRFWENEYRVVDKFLATDQSKGRQVEVRDGTPDSDDEWEKEGF